MNKTLVHYDYLLLKLAMRCNIGCTYCYWFREDNVYKKPKLLTKEAESAVVQKLFSYLKRNKIEYFEIIFHGGEPLLFGKKRFDVLCEKLSKIEKSINCKLQFSVTTNALLIDEEWIELFKKYHINVGVSLDGNQIVNDKYRVDFKGRGTFNRIKSAIDLMHSNNLDFGVLAVYHPEYSNSANELCQSFVEELNIKSFDVLIPDATYEDDVNSIANFYKGLFDSWYDTYSKSEVKIFITIIECIIRGALGLRRLSNAIGYTPVKTITVLTDGTIEPLDYLRVAENDLTSSQFNVFQHELEALQQHPTWQEAYHASLNLHEKCNHCKYKFACGGGPLQSRWSNKNRFNNPSLYCDDLYQIFDYALTRINKDLYLEKNNAEIA